MAKKKAELNAAAATPPTASAVSGHRPTVLQSLVAPAASPHLSAVADSNSAAVETISQVLTASNALEMFRAAALRLGDMTADSALQASAAALSRRINWSSLSQRSIISVSRSARALSGPLDWSKHWQN